MGSERTWHSYLRPQRIDVRGGRVYLFGAPRGQRQFTYFRYSDTRDRHITLAEKAQHWCAPTGDKHQFDRTIDVGEYMHLAAGFARLAGGEPLTE